MVERRTGKLIAQRRLEATDGGCPPVFVGKQGDQVRVEPLTVEVDQLLADPRK